MDRRLVLALLLSLGLMASACAREDPTLTAGGGGEEQQEETQEDAGHAEDEGEGHEDQGTKVIAGHPATYHGTADVAGMSEFELEADDHYFGPTVLEGEAGQQLALGLYNEGDEHHTFTIDEAGIDEDLPSGADGISIDVTFPDFGALVFYCRFHREQGMHGALSVGGSLETSAGASGAMEGPDYDYG